jgi:hypothetical protein
VPLLENAAGVREVASRFRFGLKALLALVTPACVLLAIVAQPIVERYREERLVKAFTARGVEVSYGGIVSRGSVRRALLAMFDSRYDEYPLYRFNCSKVAITDDDLAQLVRLKHIQELDLGGSRVTDDGLRHLRGLPYLSRLELSNTGVTDDGLVHLGTLPMLDWLRVHRTALTYDGLARLDAVSPYLQSRQQRAIEELKAAGVQIVHFENYVEVPDATYGTRTARNGESVHDVLIGMQKAVSFSAEQLRLMSYLGRVERVTFHSVTLGPQGLKPLEPLPGLRRLEFYVTNLQESDLEAIGRQTGLEYLEIYQCPITDAGLAHLKRLTNLKELRISNCANVSREALSKLRSELPRLE